MVHELPGPPGLPKYMADPPCRKFSYEQTGSPVVYQILPGNAAAAVPPVELSGDLFEHCVDQFTEVMMGFAQTGSTTIQMTKDWCSMQSAVTNWVGADKQPSGRPDWSFRNCNNMVNLLAFSLKDTLHDGLPAMKVCKKIFLSMGAIHRVETLIKDAWAVSARGLGNLALTTATDDEAAKKLLQQAQEYAAGVNGQMSNQRDAFNDANAAKMDASSFA